MIDQIDDEDVTCREIESEAFLETYALSDEYHDFEEETRTVVTDVPCCKVAFIEEECSYCSARLSDVRVVGDAPESMDEYRRLLYDVYEWFFDDPRSHDRFSLSGGITAEGRNMQLVITSNLKDVVEYARDDAEMAVGKQSREEIWTKVLGPEYADAD
ncbi:hypothetical protein [Halosimplex pelagicum]|uniref:Uncharacterized protein n=1 Tax=Halosimplex pelagicum TaxID=869886 RepID=A0A7D5TBK6_9EURY|nr:hypothetical protein [Halosimplex pelagicum]QLH83790.1 hypothetical protein HZS54_20100 [Halosimplex pelagicum]